MVKQTTFVSGRDRRFGKAGLSSGSAVPLFPFVHPGDKTSLTRRLFIYPSKGHSAGRLHPEKHLDTNYRLPHIGSRVLAAACRPFP